MGILGAIGSAMGSPFGSIGSAVGGAIGNSIDGNSNRKKARQDAAYQAELEYKYWQQKYATQRADALQDYARQREDYVSDLLSSKAREVQSLRNAGLSPAAAVESGFSPNAAEVDTRSSDGGSTSVSDIASGSNAYAQTSLQSQLLGAQIQNLNSQSNKNDSDSKLTQTIEDQMRQKFQNWLDSQRDPENMKLQQEAYKSVYDTLESRLQNAKTSEEIENIKKEKEEIDARISNYNASTDSITFNTSKAAALLPKELAKIQSSIQADLASAKASLASANESNARAYLTRIQGQFAKLGIGLGSNWVDSAVALCKGLGDGGATTIANSLTSIFNQVLSGFKPSSNKNIGAAKSLLKGFSDNSGNLGPGATSLFWPFILNAFGK